jgi:hypothetical protein
VVCFISTAGYLTGPAFTGMREYLRRHVSEGWIINLTPEGQTPDIPTRVFPGVRQTLAIGLFVRSADTRPDVPASIHYRVLTGRQADKFAALAQTRIDDDGWRDSRTGWTAPLTPAAGSDWDRYAALSDLFPWYSPGVFPTRTWVYARNKAILERSWRVLTSETDQERQSILFKEGPDATLDKGVTPLPGPGTHAHTRVPVRGDSSSPVEPIRVGYRAFDRHTRTFADELTMPGVGCRSPVIRHCGAGRSGSVSASSGCTPTARRTRGRTDRPAMSATRTGTSGSRCAGRR